MKQKVQTASSRQAGFTMIEVMITVVILALAVGVALPSYIESVKRSSRNEARAVLLENQLWMEQQFTTNNTYGTKATTILPFLQSPKKGKAKYKIAIADGMTATTYTLTATPETGVDTKCGTFSIDQTGKRDLLGTHSMGVDDCWAGK